MPDFELNGRVAVVTGASRGLGTAIATGLAEQGAKVVLSSRRQADLDREADTINRRFPGRAAAVAAHAGRPDELERLFARTIELHGRLDILINNAGTNPYHGSLIEAEMAAWDKTFEVNLRGYFLATQFAWRSWMRDHGGAVVNIASTGGLRPSPGLGVYDITKAGVVMMTRQLARELRGVRVNCIAPGLFRTRFAEALWQDEEVARRIRDAHPLGRIGSPEEIAGAACFLVSDAASYINGAVLVVDGGGTEAA